METQSIVVRGAREHNLQNVHLELPRNALICFTGVSGSGKSSLAFDTIYAEGQRRYVESLSSYARQFLGQLPKPDVDYIGGLSPAVSIQQKTAGRNPRSTVGTITEVADYLRVLYARLGVGHCPKCGKPITAQTREQIIGRILALPEGTRFLLLAPVVRGQKGEFKDFFADMIKRGYVRARVDGQIVKLTDDLRLDKRIKHDIAIVIDRLQQRGTRNAERGMPDSNIRVRVAEAVEQALNLAEGNVVVSIEAETPADSSIPNSELRIPHSQDILLSAHYACTKCDISYEPPSPQLFSFNSPHGMCLDCDGLGNQFTFDPDLIVPDPNLSFTDGAIPLVGPFKSMGKWRRHIFEGVAKTLDIDLKKPWKKLPAEKRELLLQGSGDTHIVWEWKQRHGVWKHGGKWEGIVPQLLSQFKKTAAGPRRMQLEKYMRVVKCPACGGQRLNPQARSVKAGGKTLVELGRTPIGELVPWFDTYRDSLPDVARTIAGELLKEIRSRLGFLLNVGLHYLTLDRAAPTLSGGEAQRIRLAGQIGSGLVGVLYVLDEPSIGLHPRDNARLLASLERLRDMGNTVLVVEHDEETMRAADYLVDFGPGPGVRGGHVVAAGPPSEVLGNEKSLTAQYLSGAKEVAIPAKRRPIARDRVLRIVGAKQNNLKNVTVDIPLGVFVCVTGVSGSGKSSLVNDILREALSISVASGGRQPAVSEDDEEDETPHTIGAHDKIEGAEHIDKVIDIDQAPIGRTPRSNPATYIKLWDEIRSLYADMADAKVRGYQPGRFSFNKPGGRCEACEGNGSNKLEMDFLADVWVTCPVCEGRRFNRETLQVKYRGKSIQDVLEMEVAEALEHFEHIPKVRAMVQTLHDVGLDYIKLGQPSPTLSGGEAQRIKLAKELVRRSTGKTLYILDEPTTGLHFEDVRKLLEVLHNFAEQGNTVLVIEHNLDVIKTADWVIDLGPEGGSGGGEIVATGTPEQIAKVKKSFTGRALSPILNPSKSPATAVAGRSTAAARQEYISHLEIDGASQHNLKHVSARLPRDSMNVFCGPSGSGKSSLALDTIYAEGQRRYVESLSSYARQFLGQVQKPKVEHIAGLSPAIAIEQKTTSKSPRSTVGTITEIYDYLRILFARLGQRHCPSCGQAVGTQTSDEIVDKVLSLPEGTKLYIMAPLERKGQEKYETLWEEIRRAGFVRMRVGRKSYGIDEPPSIDHRRKHKVEVVIDRNVVKPGTRSRLAEAVEQALDLGRGVMHIGYVDADKDETKWKVEVYSQHLACDKCNLSFEPLNPHHYSFNSPLGWCPTCEGLGVQNGANANLLLGDTTLSLREGAVAGWPSLEAGSAWLPFAQAIAAHAGFDLDTPYEKLDAAQTRAILHGTGENWLSFSRDAESSERSAKRRGAAALRSADSASRLIKFQYKGLFPAVDEASRVSFVYRQRLEHLVDEVPCSTCAGSRLRSDSAATRFAKFTLGDLTAKPLGDVLRFFEKLDLSKRDRQVAGEVLREIVNRTRFLVDVGLDYLSLARSGPTLSGGEAQRIRLASQIGSGLTGVLYVLDEPTIGLHPRDNERLLQALKNLRDLGNTLVLVEHDREVIAAADYLLDFGPGAGDQGGEITAAGTPKQLVKAKDSLTGRYLSGKLAIPVPTNRRAMGKKRLSIIGARQHNLRNVDVELPLGCFIAVTGVSGSGKSSLVNEVLYNTLARKLHRARTAGAAHDEIRGLEHIDKIINVDQDSIGNSPSSNPATYTGVFDLIRELFARLPESKIRGYHPRRFSFNQKGGRCEACEGMGQKKIEMHFLPDVWVECDTCRGSRFNPETLAVKYHEKSIADVLTMRVSEALELFGNVTKIRPILQTLDDVGLGYMSLGQSAPTMSGGEAQRVKLAAELARPSTGKTLYLLDEPTTGLHFDDIRKLLDVLHRLVDLGNTVIVVEHNLDVVKTADYMIDLGPEAGHRGGQIVAKGTPEQVVEQFDAGAPTQTGRILKGVLEAGPHAERAKYDPKAALRAKEGDLEIADVGKDQKLPWEADGPKWHAKDRITTTGKPMKWDGAALLFVVDLVHSLGTFSETDWSTRSIVEIAAAKKSDGWFVHLITGHEAYVKFTFRLPGRAFKEDVLESQLKLKPLSDTPGLEGFSRDANRVEVANYPGGQQVVITVNKKAEIDTPEFRAFLKRAVETFLGGLENKGAGVEAAMPWKKDGEKWHLSEKGFPLGRKLRWDRSVLPRLLAVLKDVDDSLEYKWDVRDAITIRPAGSSRFWCRIKTKESDALEAWFIGTRGQINLASVEGIGRDPALEGDRNDGSEVLKLRFLAMDQLQPAKLKDVLKAHLKAFVAQFQG